MSILSRLCGTACAEHPNVLQDSENELFRPYFTWLYPYLKHGMRVLNIGSGTKRMLEKDLLRRFTLDMTSLDLYPVTEHLPGVRHVVQSAETPFALNELFDIVLAFEVLEHVDRTDVLIENAVRHVQDDGYIMVSIPNLSSLWSRLELLCGYQPHLLEVSNKRPGFGQGFMGALNNPEDVPLHHIRGITYRALRELLAYNGLHIVWSRGYDWRLSRLVARCPSVASIVVVLCQKKLQADRG